MASKSPDQGASKPIDVVSDSIDLSNDDQVRDWTEALGVSREALSDAVRAVGNRYESVRGYFGNIRE
jgi:hypothetical protein